VTQAAPPPPQDPAAILRSRGFAVLLVFTAAIGIGVSFVAWGFLELVHQCQIAVWNDIPDRLGFDGVPDWWALPVLFLAGLVVAAAIVYLPGNGGHIPAEGLKTGGNDPRFVPGIALAAFATLVLGAVLGPEAPLIAIGGGLAAYTVSLVKRDAPAQLVLIVAAAGSFAAVSVIFGNPIVAAVIIIEASGLGGATLPLILVPGLIAAGIGSLVFVGMSSWTGLSTSAYALVPLQLPHFSQPSWAEIGWTLVLAVGAALVAFPVRGLGLRVAATVPRRPFVYIPIAGIAVAAAAILFAQTTTHGTSEVLFSGQESLPGLVANPAAWSLGALGLLVLCKGLAWGVSLGGFRGGPTFPALFIGAAGGVAASHLPGLPLAPAVAVGMGSMVVAVLRLPLSAVIIATALTIQSGPGVVALVIVGVVVTYLVTLALEGRLGDQARAGADPAPAPAPSPSASPSQS
jgi:H+/Cl- antiporter ClcA